MKYLYTVEDFDIPRKRLISRYDIDNGTRKVFDWGVPFNVYKMPFDMNKKNIVDNRKEVNVVLIGEYDSLDNPIEVLYG